MFNRTYICHFVTKETTAKMNQSNQEEEKEEEITTKKQPSLCLYIQYYLRTPLHNQKFPSLNPSIYVWIKIDKTQK